MFDFAYPTVVGPSSPGGADESRRLPQPGELWSLWDVYNFKIADYTNAEARISIIRNGWLTLPSAKPTLGNALASPLAGGVPSDPDRQAIADYLTPVVPVLERLEFDSALEQLNAILRKLNPRGPPVDLDEIRTHCSMLIDSMHAASRRALFFYYPNEKAKKLAKLDEAWRPVFAKFKRAETEIRVGVDLWALGHSTACIFHMMRAAELGLRVLAKERKVKFANKPTDWGTWGNLIDALDAKIIELKKKPNGPAKDRAVAFYSGAVGRMRSLNHTRDLVMHVRKDFDEHEAESVMNHVREMMTILAEKLDESSTTAIKWGIK